MTSVKNAILVNAILVKKIGNNIFSPFCIIWYVVVQRKIVVKVEVVELADAELENTNVRQSKGVPNVDARPELANDAVKGTC